MALDRLLMGQRIRNIREKIFKETRERFADRCGLTESHIGQIERGEILISLKALEKIASSTGIDINQIIYGKPINNCTRKNIETILDRSNEQQLNLIYKILLIINEKNSWINL